MFINVIMWLLGTIVAFFIGWPALVATLMGALVIALIRSREHEKYIKELIQDFKNAYGFDPPSASRGWESNRSNASQMAGGVGGLAGHLYAGVILGSLFNLAGHLKEAQGLTAEQYQDSEFIKSQQNRNPGTQFLGLCVGLAFSGLCVFFMEAALAP